MAVEYDLQEIQIVEEVLPPALLIDSHQEAELSDDYGNSTSSLLPSSGILYDSISDDPPATTISLEYAYDLTHKDVATHHDLTEEQFGEELLYTYGFTFQDIEDRVTSLRDEAQRLQALQHHADMLSPVIRKIIKQRLAGKSYRQIEALGLLPPGTSAYEEILLVEKEVASVVATEARKKSARQKAQGLDLPVSFAERKDLKALQHHYADLSQEVRRAIALRLAGTHFDMIGAELDMSGNEVMQSIASAWKSIVEKKNDTDTDLDDASE